MTVEEIQRVLQRALADCSIQVEEKEGQYNITVIGDRFINQSLVERQKTVYAPLHPYITQGKLHAVHLKVHTNKEWNTS